MILADAHLHLFRNGYPGRYGRTGGIASDVEYYGALRGVHGIGKGLVVGYEAEGIDPDNNAYLRHLACRYEWIESLAFLPSEPIAQPETVASMLADGHRGISLYLGTADEANKLAHWPQACFDLLNSASAIISLNATPEATLCLADLLPRLTGSVVMFSHLGLPGKLGAPPSDDEARERLQGLLGLQQHSGVMVKISGLYAVSDPSEAYPHSAAEPFVRTLLETFGPDRCLWGSDFSPCLDWVSFAQAVRLVQLESLSDAEYEKVMGGNLLRTLGH